MYCLFQTQRIAHTEQHTQIHTQTQTECLDLLIEFLVEKRTNILCAFLPASCFFFRSNVPSIWYDFTVYITSPLSNWNRTNSMGILQTNQLSSANTRIFPFESISKWMKRNKFEISYSIRAEWLLSKSAICCRTQRRKHTDVFVWRMTIIPNIQYRTYIFFPTTALLTHSNEWFGGWHIAIYINC